MTGEPLQGLLQWGVLILAAATPLLLASLGGLVSETGGVINFALEGMMLAGAFGAVWAAHASGSPWWGLAGGASAGLLMAAIHAVACLGMRASQIVSSIALNLLAAGATGTLLNQVFEAYGTSPGVARLPSLGRLLAEVFSAERISTGTVLDTLPVTAVIALGCGLLVLVLFDYTALGLAVRACGEAPDGARAAGIAVARVRSAMVLFGGALAGLGGASLSIGTLAQFVERMTQGRGYLAIAALILGRWNPKGVILASLFLGALEAASEWASIAWPRVPHQALLAFPYALTLLLLPLHIGKGRAPSALGKL